jgi:DNA-dependent RNA polymerase auxiliary subunit epsilon
VSKKLVTEANYSVEYLAKVLDLIGLIAHSIGDLDQLPLSNDIVSLLMETSSHQKDASYVQKRELLISFIMSQIDDKNLRLDL